jgi:hypothetical protein
MIHTTSSGLTTMKTGWLSAAVVLCLFTACGDNATDTDTGFDVISNADVIADIEVISDATADSETGFSRETEMWAAGPAAPVSSLFVDYGLTEFNPYTEEIEWTFENGKPVFSYDSLAFYAVANGHTFSFVGTDYPLSVLHEIYGPDYNRPDLETFSDITFTALRDGAKVRFNKSGIGRFSKSSIVGVTNVADGIKVSHLFVAPQTADTTFDASILVVARIENTGTQPIENLAFAAFPYSGTGETGLPDVIAITRGNRQIHMVLDGATWNAESKAFAGATFSLAPGQSADAAFWLFMTEGFAVTDPAPHFAELAASAPLADMVSDTDTAWRTWFDAGLQVTAPDPKVTGLIESFLYTIAAQTSHDGAMTPLSHYGEYWTRDLSGAVRMLAIASRTDDVKRMLDYHRVAACANHGFFNASTVNLPVNVPCAVTDWSALPPLEDKTAAEAPSYVVHMYHRLFDSTGDKSLIQERLPMLRYALGNQAISPEYLLPFSEDETFRPAMAMNTGIGGPEFVWSDKYWSLQSSLIFVAAADGLARTLGLAGDDPIVTMRDQVAGAIDKYYWLEDPGIFAPVVTIDGLEPYPHPYEDVNLTASWMNLENFLGWEHVKRDIDILVAESWMEDLSIIQTNIGQNGEILGYDTGKGIFTGMTPGFSLYAAARHRPDIAQKAFNVFPRLVTASGNVTEDYATIGFRVLMPMYEPNGKMSEFWARFRPWEGGQDGEAMLFYLTGLYPDAAARRVDLAPHMPNNWPQASYKGLVAAGCSFDMTITEKSDMRREYHLVFTGSACDGLTVNLKTATWTCGERDDCKPTVSGPAEPEFNSALAQSGIARFTAVDGLDVIFTATKTDQSNQTPKPFVVITFNTGGGAGGSDDLPNEGFHSEQFEISDDWYGNGLAWPAFITAAAEFIAETDPDVIVFQEVFWTGDCPGIPEEFHTGFICEDWTWNQPTVVQMILSDDFQIVCNFGKPDKCAAVNRRFGTFQGCGSDFCLEGMTGATVESCGKGSRVGRGVIDLVGGGTLTLVNFHGSSGLKTDDSQCRVKQIDQVFINLGDGQPAASGEVNLIMGDLNTDPARFAEELSAIRWNDFVGEGKAFHFITEVGMDVVPTYHGIANIDHVISDQLVGNCWHPGVTEGHPPVTEATYFDHNPSVCTVQMPEL